VGNEKKGKKEGGLWGKVMLQVGRVSRINGKKGGRVRKFN